MTKPVQILAINGSPRPNGNTEILVDAVLQGAKDSGASIKKFNLREMEIHPCLACDACTESRQCFRADDLSVLVQAMKDSEIWVFGTPVYYWGPTAQFKAFMDRWYGIDQNIFKGKKVIAAIPLGDKDSNVARHTVGIIQDSLTFQGAELVATVLAPDVFDKDSIRKYPDLLQQAYKIGQETVAGMG